MIKQVYIVLFSLLVISCSSVPKSYLETNNLCKYDAPIFTITKEELTFDIKNYGEQLKKKRITLRNSKDFKNEYWKLSTGYITNKQTNKQLGISKWVGFYKNGKIESIHFRYEYGNDVIFKRFLYDKKGEIEEIIDYDKGYKICWAEAIAIVRKIAKQEIKRYGVTQFYAVHNNLNKFPNEKATWFVGFMDGNDKLRKYEYKKGAIRYKIDGVTGKFLGTRHIITEHN